MWEGAARWSTQLRRGCWVATGLTWWMGCSDLQGSGRGRESINPAKMKLCPGCHNPFASSKLYKLFAVYFFAFEWWLVWHSCIPICRDVAFEFLCSPEVICGILGNDVFFQSKRTPGATRKPNHKNNKQTTKPNHKNTNKKQNNQNLGK